MQIMPPRFDGDLSPAFGKGQPARKCPEGRRGLLIHLNVRFWGVKQTLPEPAPMSGFDPKQTSHTMLLMV